jgi:hypothetical protein
MTQACTYYDYHSSLTWGFIREEIGRGLRERYQVPNELPIQLLALVRKLEGVESNQSPCARTLIGKLDTIEGRCVSRYARPVEPRSVGPNDDWFFCT